MSLSVGQRDGATRCLLCLMSLRTLDFSVIRKPLKISDFIDVPEKVTERNTVKSRFRKTAIRERESNRELDLLD